MFNVKADQGLFDRWHSLAMDFEQFKGIVQNDMRVTEHDIENFKIRFVEWRGQSLELFNDTLEHISKHMDDKE